MKIKLRYAHIIKVGDSFYFTIPRKFISSGLIERKKEYELSIKINTKQRTDAQKKQDNSMQQRLTKKRSKDKKKQNTVIQQQLKTKKK